MLESVQLWLLPTINRIGEISRKASLLFDSKREKELLSIEERNGVSCPLIMVTSLNPLRKIVHLSLLSGMHQR